MHRKFDHLSFEKKWQEKWRDTGIYTVGDRDDTKEKEYILVEWPYPSGNLHIGHWFTFAVLDIYARARRMQGKQVLFPIGFDAFGLPAENAAIKRGLDPKAWTESNIAFMRTQLESMGNSFSWDKTTSSTDPEYYIWTQWMFTEFFKHNIAYRGKGKVNWCPGCNTVLANEQVLSNGTCERSGDVIEQRDMMQWMLRITQYADRLIDDLNDLDWPEHIKDAQRNWIGRSKGARIPFTLSTGDTIEVFTTRPDTLFGATYLVLAPEHQLLDIVKNSLENTEEVTAYQDATLRKREEERMAVGKDKSGVRLQGLTAINPISKEEIPVFISDYVIAAYGTGALMGVPAHDERDFEFAQKFSLPIIYVNTPVSGSTELDDTLQNSSEPLTNEDAILINSGEFSGLSVSEAKIKITEAVGGAMENTYRLRDWSIGRQRYWGVPIPIVYDPAGMPHPIPREHLPWHLPTDVDHTPTGESPLSKSKELKERVRSIFGEGWTPDYETMDTFVDSSWYFLRYTDVHNHECFADLSSQKEWMPVDIYFGGAEHTTMHLLYSRFWQKALYDLNLVTESEPYTKRINRGLVLGPDGNKMSKSKGNVVDPDEHVRGVGADTVKMYLAFMGPYGEVANYPWDMGGIAGIRRFLERVNGLSEHVVPSEPNETTRLLHKTIQKVSLDINVYKFNTAISALMVFVNHAEKYGLGSESYKTFLRLLAPFAPHLSEELWSVAGHEYSIHHSPWPVADETLTKDSLVRIGVQVNGKLRGTIEVAPTASEEEALAAVHADPAIVGKIEGEIRKVIYVPGKIMNLVLQ